MTISRVTEVIKMAARGTVDVSVCGVGVRLTFGPPRETVGLSDMLLVELGTIVVEKYSETVVNGSIEMSGTAGIERERCLLFVLLLSRFL